MLIYAKDESVLASKGVRWRERKAGIDGIVEAGRVAWHESEGDASKATIALKKWLRGLPAGHPAKASKQYCNVDDRRPGEVFFGDNLSSPNPRRNLQFDVLHPITGSPVSMPANGWRWSRALMAERIEQGQVAFGDDERKVPTFKRFLTDTDSQVPMPSFSRDRRAASGHLKAIFGEERFPNPKDREVLMRWIRLAAPDNAVILDFFGGSGTTTEAVVRLNSEDGGTRRSILVTNNEVGSKQAKALRKEGHHPGDPEWETLGVFEHVTRPRISTVVTGERPDGSRYSDGLAANVEMFDLTYLDPGMVRRGRQFETIAPLLWLEAGSTGQRIEEAPDDGWALTPAYGVLFTIDALVPFAAAVANASKVDAPPRVVFVVTDSPIEYQHAIERLPAGIETVRLYEDYLSSYTTNVEGGVR